MRGGTLYSPKRREEEPKRRKVGLKKQRHKEKMATNQTEAHEHKMAQINSQVVFFKNIDSEDFQHTYDGVPFLIKAGETLPFQYPIAMLLAKHLAMRILRKKKSKAGVVGKDDRTGKPVNLYPADEMEKAMDEIIVKTVDRPEPRKMSAGEEAKRKHEELKKEFGPQLAKDNLAAVDKKDVIKELKKRGVKFDPRATKEVLLQKLMASEAAGEGE